MQGIATFFVCLGLIAMAGYYVNAENSLDHEKNRAVAINFATYRRAVNIHALAFPGLEGTISQPVLGLPNGWTPLRSWTNNVSGGRCYVYGPASANEILAISQLLQGSHAVGTKSNGQLVTLHGVGTSLPDFIPEGSMVSVIGL